MTSQEWTIAEQDQFIADAVARDELRLRNFIRKHVLDSGEAEDILQDVFYELIESYRLMKPIEQVTAWLYRVARNRIADLFRKQKPDSLNDPAYDDESVSLEDLVPSPDAGPDAMYARNVMLEVLDDALDEMPASQRDVFIAYEVQGKSFKEIAEETGTSVNTLLSRKRYAIQHLRRRLLEMDESLGL